MIKRTIEISQQPVHLTVRDQQLLLLPKNDRVQHSLPHDGEVRLLTITDKQFERMRVFWGKMRKPPESPPRQLELF